MALPSVGGGQQLNDGNLNESILGTQGTPATPTDTGTITAAQLATGLLVCTPTAAATYTTDTGANLDALFTNAKVGSTFVARFVNVATNSSYDITMAGGTGVTMVGNLGIASNSAATDASSGQYLFRRTGTATWTAYRIA